MVLWLVSTLIQANCWALKQVDMLVFAACWCLLQRACVHDTLFWCPEVTLQQQHIYCIFSALQYSVCRAFVLCATVIRADPHLAKSLHPSIF